VTGSNVASATAIQTKVIEPARREELDLMEGLVVAGLVFFHTAMIFGTMGFYVVSDKKSVAVDVLIYAIGIWAMPLLFFSSGSSIWHSLGKRTAWKFVGNRCRRLLVPFVAGLLVTFPPSVYFMLKAENPTFNAPYNEFYLNFLKFVVKWPLFIVRPPFGEGERTGHLWFLIHLLAFSLFLLPLFLYLRRTSGRRPAKQFADFCARPGAILLLGLPIAAIEAAFGTEPTGMWSRYAYVPFLVYGFLFEGDAKFGAALRRHWKIGLIVGLGLLVTAGMGGLAVLYGAGIDPLTSYDLWSVLWRSIKGVNSWFVVVAILGLAGRARQKQDAPHADRDERLEPVDGKATLIGRVAEYVGEAQLPFYVLHMTPIVIIGFYVVQWQISAIIKYVAISLVSFVATLTMYEVGIRRIGPMRLLFGLKPRQKRPKAPQGANRRHERTRSGRTNPGQLRENALEREDLDVT